MKREEIIMMEPGARGRLDWLIAENIFGWKPITNEITLARLNGTLQRPAENGWWKSEAGENRYYPPSYSTNMAEAWRVVEALQEAEFWLRTISGRNGKWEPSATVEVGKLPDTSGNPSKQLASLSGLPVPEMICKMALVAILGL